MNTKIKNIISSEFKEYAKLKSIQEQVIDNIITNGSTLAIAPTGSGKSLMYWISARILKGTCVVISPLISLIEEQVSKLKSKNYNVLSFHSSKTPSEIKKDFSSLMAFAKGTIIPDFIFVSPERIATDGFLEHCFKLQKNNIKLLVVDEVHCISQWGFDFRPFYKRIPDFLNEVFGNNWPILLAMTATINPKELEDVCIDLRIPKSSVIRDLNRPLRHDINVFVEKYSLEDQKTERLFDLLKEHNGQKVLVYLYRKYAKNGVEDLCLKAQELGFCAEFFHGDMNARERQLILDDFKSGKTNVIFATNAFGMGIDIPDIRVVIHFMIPESIEQYYQEIGRGGRDECGVKAYILYTNKNIQIRKQFFIEKSFLTENEIKDEFTKQFQGEIGLKSLQFFDEDKFASIFNNLIKCKSISFITKGLSNFDTISDIRNKELDSLFSSVRKKSAINIINKNNINIKSFFELVYNSIVKNEISFQKSVSKCIFLKVNNENLTANQIKEIVIEQDNRKQYKHYNAPQKLDNRKIINNFVQLNN